LTLQSQQDCYITSNARTCLNKKALERFKTLSETEKKQY